MGYWLADGSLERHSGIHIAKKMGLPLRNDIIACIERMGFSTKERENGIVFYNTEINAFLEAFGRAHDKFIPSDILNATRSQIGVFLNAFIACDGYVRNGKPFVGNRGSKFEPSVQERLYYTTSPKMSGQLGELILKIGKRPSYAIQKASTTVKKDGKAIKGNYDCWKIAECNSVTATVFSKEFVQYDGFVYDLSLERNHIMYVRRNGKCFWGSNCFCFVTPILVDAEEMAKVNEAFLKGEKYIPKGKRITEYPDNFKEWVREHAADIADARDRGTEPYFIRNNAGVIDEILNPKPKELTIAEKAALRHAARTPEQEDAIRRAWEQRNHERAVIKKGAGNVLKVAQDWPEVDYSDLQSAIGSGDYMKMKAASKAVAQRIVAMRNEGKALLSLIPDVHTWHKQFTISELQGVYSAVESKLQELSTLSLAEQKKKLEFEIQYVADPSKFKPGAKQRPTWKVAQDAYVNRLDRVNYEIAVNDAKAKLAKVKAWSLQHPKSLKVAGYLADAELAIANGADIKVITGKVNLANNEYLKRLAEQNRRNAKKGATIKAKSGSFDPADYTADAKNKAICCKSEAESLSAYRGECEDAWNDATAAEREAWEAYTAGSGHMNRPLRGYDRTVTGGYNPWSKGNYVGVGNVDLNVEGGEAHIRDFYKLIERHPMQSNRWIQRGIETWEGVEGFIGVSGLTPAQLQGMVGKEVVDWSFMSCGSAKGTGFGGTILNIYCPKGTKGFYGWTHSHFYGINHENEIFLQAGTIMRITKVEIGSYGQVYIDLEVVGYAQHPSL